jgi:hypothetical protein
MKFHDPSPEAMAAFDKHFVALMQTATDIADNPEADLKDLSIYTSALGQSLASILVAFPDEYVFLFMETLIKKVRNEKELYQAAATAAFAIKRAQECQ